MLLSGLLFGSIKSALTLFGQGQTYLRTTLFFGMMIINLRFADDVNYDPPLYESTRPGL